MMDRKSESIGRYSTSNLVISGPRKKRNIILAAFLSLFSRALKPHCIQSS
jgi:hypothetical protein